MSLFDRDGKRKYLNVAERLAVYHAALELPDPAERAFCLTLIYSGCRISEALNLRTSDIDLGDNLLVFRTLKQRKALRYRALPMPRELLDLLQSVVCRADPNSAVWSWSRTTAWRRIQALMATVELDGTKACAKGLRHGFAIANVSEGVPITTIQKWMGHSQLRTTSIYLDFVGEDERAFAKRAWPRI